MKLREIAARIGGELHGDGSIEITGVAGIREAEEGEITFFANTRYEGYLCSTRASAIILAENGKSDYEGKTLLVNSNPYLAFLKTIEIFRKRDYDEPRGVHETAIIGNRVKMGTCITVGAHVIIEDGCTIGRGTRILPGSYLGFRSRVGEDCLVYPNVTIREDTVLGDRVIVHAGTVIGSDGFGFTKSGEQVGERNSKIHQIGYVLIEDDVEIGSNVTIDRATVGITHIKKGTKIDNLVQIAHNVVIGEDSLIVAQVGISGSTEVGRNVTLAGQVGIVGHIKVGDNVEVGAQSGVTKSVPADTRVSGYPAREHRMAKRILSAMKRLPEIVRKVSRIEKRLEMLEQHHEQEG